MNLNIILPRSFPEQIGAILMLIAVICLFISFRKKQNQYASKVFAILLISALSLFASNSWIYFSTIFIIATAITEIEFLQNLAAIIRKDQNYFNYKKETLSKEESIQRKAGEEVENEILIKENLDKNKNRISLSSLNEISQSSNIRLAYQIEENTLNFLSKKYGYIEREVKLQKGKERIIVDGLITNQKNKINTIFEIKWVRNSDHVTEIVRMALKKIEEVRVKHERITGLNSEFHLVIILPMKNSVENDKEYQLKKLAIESNVFIEFYSLNEVGFEVVD